MFGLLHFFQGVGFGLTLQLSIGPVCMTVLQLAMVKGVKQAFRFVAGVTLVDALYIVFAFLGISQILRIPLAEQIVLFLGGSLLVYFGFSHFRAKANLASHQITGRNQFVYGMTLTLTNPLTILFWTGVFGSLLASSPESDSSGIVWFSVGCVTATLLFLGMVALLGKYLSPLFDQRSQKALNWLVGAVLLFFGGKMLFHFVTRLLG